MRYGRLIIVALWFVSTASLAQGPDGKTLFATLCEQCHATQGPPKVAPPIFAVVNHVKSVYPDRAGFVKRVVDWVLEPNAQDVLMPGAVNRFGLMPKQPFKADEVRAVAEYLYDGKIKLPPWYIEHFRQQHGTDPVQQ